MDDKRGSWKGTTEADAPDFFTAFFEAAAKAIEAEDAKRVDARAYFAARRGNR